MMPEERSPDNDSGDDDNAWEDIDDEPVQVQVRVKQLNPFAITTSNDDDQQDVTPCRSEEEFQNLPLTTSTDSDDFVDNENPEVFVNEDEEAHDHHDIATLQRRQRRMRRRRKIKDHWKTWAALQILLVAAVLLLIHRNDDDSNNNNDNNISQSGKSSFPYDMVMPSTMKGKKWRPLGGFRYQEYTNGSSPYFIPDSVKQQSDRVARARRQHVREAMKNVWQAYSKYAFGQDELQPLSQKGNHRWGNIATTLVDALDTLWLMNLTDEFKDARNYVATDLSHNQNTTVIVFETTIRNLAGLLSAYDWSGDAIFVTRAVDLAKRLFRSFDSTKNGIPRELVNLQTGVSLTETYASSLARLGTLQLEFRYLDKVVASPETAHMRQAVEHIYELLQEMHPPHGLFPTLLKTDQMPLEFANDYLTLGGEADSFYEYLLKVWIQGKEDDDKQGEEDINNYRRLYDRAMQGLHDELLQISPQSGLWYLSGKHRDTNQLDHQMHHLACFAGGMLALGAYTLGMDVERAQRDMTTAKALTYTCYQMYARMETGISPEEVKFVPATGNHKPKSNTTQNDFVPTSKEYILRPEVVESLFVLHQITGDPIYREWGWEIFVAIETFCKTDDDGAYAALSDVTNATDPKQRDSMESFFLAETLKYLYLLFDPDSPVDILHTHVFNTEAHPMRIFSKLR